ncbi:MAG: AraC family transcriptional regulator, partial [Clostridiales bacterium]|nr:AraC family transcriptional regulator [Clostridiales bacterium]
MEWIQRLNQAIGYIEGNICENMTAVDIASNVYMSNHHFQRVFSLMTGMTIGEYVRNRRLSLAGSELSRKDVKVVDIAFKYGYDTPESFTKAFTRFHGVTPSGARKEGAVLKSFAPLDIKIKLQGCSFMDYRIESKPEFQILAMTRTFDAQSSSLDIPKFWSEFYAKGYGQVVCGVYG